MRSDLASLVGSRICHDLVSPLGAISNGVELIGMTQQLGGAEMALINDSVTNANARIRFFRVAFGDAGADQMMRPSEAMAILTDYARGGRLTYDWRIPDAQRRTDVRAAFLILLCFETALPRGGSVTVDRDDTGWTLTARGDQLRWDVDLWDSLTNPGSTVEPTAAEVQFALLPTAVGLAAKTLDINRFGNEIAVTLR